MSSLGENADRILELLSKTEKLSVSELKEKLPSVDIAIINFMKECGLIEAKNEEIRITEFGLNLLAVE